MKASEKKFTFEEIENAILKASAICAYAEKDFLTKEECETAKILRKNFVIEIYDALKND